jgi:DNA mismatch endonuclease (patch repair protein)
MGHMRSSRAGESPESVRASTCKPAAVSIAETSAARKSRSRDVMSPQARSALMARIRGKDTGPERALAEEIRRFRFNFEQHAADLPGRPDMVFRARRVAVLVDGDFWHGWRFPLWKHKLSPFWRAKIAGNRRRDVLVLRRLRRRGWKVVRIWEHQLEQELDVAVRRLVTTLRASPPTRR